MCTVVVHLNRQAMQVDETVRHCHRRGDRTIEPGPEAQGVDGRCRGGSTVRSQLGAMTLSALRRAATWQWHRGPGIDKPRASRRRARPRLVGRSPATGSDGASRDRSCRGSTCAWGMRNGGRVRDTPRRAIPAGSVQTPTDSSLTDPVINVGVPGASRPRGREGSRYPSFQRSEGRTQTRREDESEVTATLHAQRTTIESVH